MDSFRLCLALGPVAIYLLLLGAINVFRRPFLVSGTRDLATLGLAVSGLVLVGPIELFFPIAASINFGPLVWAFLIALYALCLVLALLMMRPRLVVYNISADELRPVLANLIAELDPDTRWAGDSLAVPSLGIQARLESSPRMRNVSLLSNGPRQSHQGWRRLEVELGSALRQVEVPPNPRAISLIGAGTLLVVALVGAIARDPQAVAQSLFEMFRI